MAFNEKTNKYEGYIYCITNQVNGKKYIGQTSTTIEHRWSNHKSDAKTYDYALYRAMKKYGIENFIISQIEKIESEDFNKLKCILNDLEIKYIKEYETIISDNKGYNMTIGGNNSSERNKSPVDMYDINGNLIKSFNSTLDAALYLSCGATWIQNCCQGKNYIYTVHGYVFRYKGDSFDKYSINGTHKKACYKFDMNGNLIEVYGSKIEAAKQNNLNIRSLESSMRRRKSLNGNYYSLTNEIDLNEYKPSLSKDKKIGMYDKDTGELLKVFPKLSYVKEFLGKDYEVDSCIVRTCKDFSKSAYGYRWQYIN